MSDAFHMAADSLSIGVGILALLMSKREHPSRRFSYGLAGTETVGMISLSVPTVYHITNSAYCRRIDQWRISLICELFYCPRSYTKIHRHTSYVRGSSLRWKRVTNELSSEVKNPLYVVYVASGGLTMNLFGMFLFMGIALILQHDRYFI